LASKRHSNKTASNLQCTHVLILYCFSYKTCDGNVKIYYNNLEEVSVPWFKMLQIVRINTNA